MRLLNSFHLFILLKSFFWNHKIRLQSLLDLRWERFDWIYICPIRWAMSIQHIIWATGETGPWRSASPMVGSPNQNAPDVYVNPTYYPTSFETVLKLQRFFKGEQCQSNILFEQLEKLVHDVRLHQWSLVQIRTLQMLMSIQHIIQHLLKQF